MRRITHPVFLTVFFVIISCCVFAQERIKIGEIVDNEPVITMDSATLVSAFESAFNDGTTISTVKIERSGDYFYVEGFGNNAGEARAMAEELNNDGGELYLLPTSESHSCSGVNCESSGFRKSPSGKISGCQCLQPGGAGESYSNHTISTVSRLYKPLVY
ncbi:MAG: hypothetical protein GXO82_09555 [Chlorobi bacterium]|nr:hypothetical protein [Chlorobiota bacterium]